MAYRGRRREGRTALCLCICRTGCLLLLSNMKKKKGVQQHALYLQLLLSFLFLFMTAYSWLLRQHLLYMYAVNSSIYLLFCLSSSCNGIPFSWRRRQLGGRDDGVQHRRFLPSFLLFYGVCERRHIYASLCHTMYICMCEKNII